MLDYKCMKAINTSKGLLVVWYLLYQYMWNIRKERLLSDRMFTVIRRRLVREWNEINHIHKPLLDKHRINTVGKYFSNMERSYPSLIKGAAVRLETLLREKKVLDYNDDIPF